MNSVSRYYLPAKYWLADQLELIGDEAHHCTRVLRSKEGDHVEVFDGEGMVVQGEITSLSKDSVIIKLSSKPIKTTPLADIHLIQSIPKGGNMELIVQKAVELGIHSIQPLITANTVVRPEQIEKKLIKWQRIALEACKQCGQNYLPTIHPVMKFSEWITDGKSKDLADLNLVAALLPNSQLMHTILSENELKQPKSASFLIGPEGDFSNDEYQLILATGYSPVSLGDIVLRVETATLYCLSVIKHELSSH